MPVEQRKDYRINISSIQSTVAGVMGTASRSMSYGRKGRRGTGKLLFREHAGSHGRESNGGGGRYQD